MSRSRRDISYDTLCSAPPFIAAGGIVVWLSDDERARIDALLRKNVPRLAAALGIAGANHGDTCRKIARMYKHDPPPRVDCDWSNLFAAHAVWERQHELTERLESNQFDWWSCHNPLRLEE